MGKCWEFKNYELQNSDKKLFFGIEYGINGIMGMGYSDNVRMGWPDAGNLWEIN